jgi:TonB family protein
VSGRHEDGEASGHPKPRLPVRWDHFGENEMKLWPVVAFLGAALAAASLPAEQTQSPQGAQRAVDGKPKTTLKLIKAPLGPYPEEAQRKGIEGTVTLRIVVDERGRVSDAKALSGPAELLQAALKSVRQWEFAPPAKAPVVTTAEVAYGHPRECPGALSDSGTVGFATRLKSKRGTYAYLTDEIDRSVPYPDAERKSGIGGEMIIALTVDPEGKVVKVQVVKSLSANLDKVVTETVRTWRFRVQPGGADALPDDFPLYLSFQPTCDIDF